MPTYLVFEEGTGWVDSSGAAFVSSVTAADTSVVVGGTTNAPTIRTNTLDVLAADHPAAADWSNNGYKITNLADGVAASDAATVGQIGGGGGVTSLDSITGAVTLVAGSNVTITDNSPSAGDITIAATAGGSAGLVKLFDSTLALAAASIDTGAGGIASGHGDLIVLSVLQTDEAVARSVVSWLINNDTGAHYDRQYNSASASTLAAGTSLAQTSMQVFTHGASGTSGYPGMQQLSIPSYSATTFFKLIMMFAMVADATAGNNQSEVDSFGWRSTAAISRLSVSAPAGKNLVAGSRLAVYGTQ